MNSPQQTTLKTVKGLPPRNKSAFLIFSSEMRKKVNQESTQKLNANDMMSKLGLMWKNLDSEKRASYEAQAEKDKERYKREMEVYEANVEGPFTKNKTKSNYIKKACSAYSLFLIESKDKLKAANPSVKMADIMKIISAQWKALDNITRLKYEKISNEQKASVLEAKKALAPLVTPRHKKRRNVKKGINNGKEKGSTESLEKNDECLENIQKHIKSSNSEYLGSPASDNKTTNASYTETETYESPNFSQPSSTQLLESIDFNVFKFNNKAANIRDCSIEHDKGLYGGNHIYESFDEECFDIRNYV